MTGFDPRRSSTVVSFGITNGDSLLSATDISSVLYPKVFIPSVFSSITSGLPTGVDCSFCTVGFVFCLTTVSLSSSY